MAGSGGNRRPTWGVGEEREAGFENRIPAISGAGAGGRERGVGAGNAAHARAWPTWAGGGGDVGAAAVAGAAASGWRLGEDPTGGPHLSAGGRARARRRTGPTWAEERESGFGPTFGPKPKEDFLKPFSI